MKENRNVFSSMFSLLFVILLVISLFAAAFGGTTKTFTSFFETLSAVPSVEMDWMDAIRIQTIPDLPDIFSWLNGFITFINSTLSLGTFVVQGVFNALTVFVYFIGYVFS